MDSLTDLPRFDIFYICLHPMWCVYVKYSSYKQLGNLFVIADNIAEAFPRHADVLNIQDVIDIDLI